MHVNVLHVQEPFIVFILIWHVGETRKWNVHSQYFVDLGCNPQCLSHSSRVLADTITQQFENTFFGLMYGKRVADTCK